MFPGIMKVKTISRNPDDYQRETNRDIHKLVRNWNAPQDSFRAQTEYTRALNATKLERVFAKPFVAGLDGHLEGVNILAKHPGRPSLAITGARDGQVKIWNLASRNCLSTIQTHEGQINGLSVDVVNGEGFVTVGHDQQLKFWRLPTVIEGDLSEPEHSIGLPGVALGVSHLALSSDFATCGDNISVWKPNRDSPIRAYDLGPDTIHAVKANPIEESVILGACSDRSIFVLDTRQKTPLKKVVMKLRPNSISWNPIDPFTFTVASDDYNLYTFDMRYLSHPKFLHGGHTMAVIDVDYSPTGQEFVSASFDRTVRIFEANQTRSRDVYHTKRMHSVLSCMYSMDSKFVLCGSVEMNVRVWKSNAAEKIGPLAPREKAAFEYNQKLREQFKDHPEIRRIAKHRQVPKSVLAATREHEAIRKKRARKDHNRHVFHSAGITTGEKEFVPDVQKSMVESQEQ